MDSHRDYPVVPAGVVAEVPSPPSDLAVLPGTQQETLDEIVADLAGSGGRHALSA
jgi:hypothetical protein